MYGINVFVLIQSFTSAVQVCSCRLPYVKINIAKIVRCGAFAIAKYTSHKNLYAYSITTKKKLPICRRIPIIYSRPNLILHVIGHCEEPEMYPTNNF